MAHEHMSTQQQHVTQQQVEVLIQTVDVGLSHGLGKPAPGKMCVEAAVCYALGLPHGDDPGCVAPSLRQLKIALNDSCWSSQQTRARGLRKLAVLQLGSKGALDETEFVKRLVPLARMMADRAAATEAAKTEEAEWAAATEAAEAATEAAERAERAAEAAWAAEATEAEAAEAAAWTAEAAAQATEAADTELQFFANAVCDILIDMSVPGVKWLPLLGSL